MDNRRLIDYQERLDRELKVSVRDEHVRIRVTSKLCVYTSRDRDYTLNVMRNISGYASGKKTPVHLDLRACPGMTAAAMVMLFAEITRARLVTQFDGIVRLLLPDENTKLRKMLQDTDWETATTTPFASIQDLVTQNLCFQSNNDPNQATEAVYNLLIPLGLNLDIPEVQAFTKGVTEAMLNVINHAYDNEEDPLNGIGRRWWQACYVKGDGTHIKSMVFIIYDLGQGILNSLPPLEQETPKEHIDRAMLYGVTSTGDPKRGKGSEDIKNAAIRDGSILLVGTNNVSYIKLREDLRITDTTLPFFGTIVEWQINL